MTGAGDDPSSAASDDWAPVTRARHRLPRGGRPCTLLVLGSTGAWGNERQSAKFMAVGDRRESAHVSIGRKGRGVIHASVDEATLHSPGAVDWDGRGQVNLRSVSVLLCNRGGVRQKTAHDFFPRAPYGWVRAPHYKTGRLRSWEVFGEPQLRGLVELLDRLREACPELEYVTGREDLVRSALDPGPAFPWASIDWRRWGLTRLAHDWAGDAWHRWRGPKRRRHEPGREGAAAGRSHRTRR